jgi:hypothetical protein
MQTLKFAADSGCRALDLIASVAVFAAAYALYGLVVVLNFPHTRGMRSPHLKDFT